MDLFFSISQTSNQPDINQSIIRTNTGMFDIGSLSVGDTIGYANINLANLSATSTLKAGIIFGQNYAFINAIDSLGDLIGFFAIENELNGVKITSTSPPDGNSYTSGLTTDVKFEKIFINPSYTTSLLIDTYIESELQDQMTFTDSTQIICPSSLYEMKNQQKVREYFNILGKRNNNKKYSIKITSKNKKRLVIYE